MGLLSREQLLKKDDLQVEKVSLGSTDFVYVREWTGSEKEDYLMSVIPQGDDGPKNMKNLRARMVVRSLCDKSGTLLLNIGDADSLGAGMSSIKLEKIADVVSRLNKLRLQDQEETEKNSEAATGGNSTSDSVEKSA